MPADFKRAQVANDAIMLPSKPSNDRPIRIDSNGFSHFDKYHSLRVGRRFPANEDKPIPTAETTSTNFLSTLWVLTSDGLNLHALGLHLAIETPDHNHHIGEPVPSAWRSEVGNMDPRGGGDSKSPGIVRRLWRRFRERLATAKAMRALGALDDRMLRDVGVSRGQIEYVARHGRDED